MPKKEVHPNIKARMMPHNDEAEQAVLGSILIDEYAPVAIMSKLATEDFYTTAHKVIFDAMSILYNRNRPIDIVTVVQQLETSGDMEKAGGIDYLTTLTNMVPAASNYRYYSDIVAENSMRRKLIRFATNLSDEAYGEGGEDLLARAESEIFALGQQEEDRSLVHIVEPLKEAIDRMESIERDPLAFRGIPTGFRALDNLLNGFQAGDLIIIAARPGQGKTSIGMNFIQAAALSGRKSESGKTVPFRCAVFSLEMPAEQLARRMLCSVAKVDMTRASSGKMDDNEWRRIMNAKPKLDAAEIFIDDTSTIRPMDIISKCRKLKREKGLDIVMIDYLQLMSSGKNVENRQQEISEITRNLKIAAKELKVPILLLSQMSRKIEDRKEKLPLLSDLRESGAIEQDADIIMFVHREHDANDMTVDEATRNKVKLIVAKHRNGRTDDVNLVWKGAYVSFEEPASHSEQPAQNEVVQKAEKMLEMANDDEDIL